MSVVTININGVEKSLKENDVIVYMNEGEASLLFDALSYAGYTWCNGERLNKNRCYVPKNGKGYCIDHYGLSHGDVEWFKEEGDEDFNIMYFDKLFTPINVEITVDELYNVIKEVVLSNGMDIIQLDECFNSSEIEYVLENNTPQSLVEKYNTWKKSKEVKETTKVTIKVGDVFECGGFDTYVVVNYNEDEKYYNILWTTGELSDLEWTKEEILQDKFLGHKDLSTLFTF